MLHVSCGVTPVRTRHCKSERYFHYFHLYESQMHVHQCVSQKWRARIDFVCGAEGACHVDIPEESYG